MAYLQTLCAHCLTANRVDDSRLSEAPKCGKCHKPLFTGQPISANDAQLTRWLSHEQLPLVVDFWAEWCGPCQSFGPAFARAAELEPIARFIKVNTEQAPQSAAQFQIRSIPTLMIFQQGKILDQQAGAPPYPQFLQWLHQTLSR
ncbi:thioredoxin TrxC [Gilvimarinus agarilyticus]|uniref:thioredoxin TrxC n=1 Tax=Gilvimarinus sp. 2_MG-2023 TaxID=3062666 RepID=UPI001C09A375|nr:thioredoxin TrxC [Gilvimarinus sp. 2_MG-2023]MBU2887879.1 thioredoxin TrxC [Gilvimarinus agarilyticus]MDO6572517.1 thioredoxin TrxC [Gilvimarinus sp. 2_MG-2023]